MLVMLWVKEIICPETTKGSVVVKTVFIWEGKLLDTFGQRHSETRNDNGIGSDEVFIYMWCKLRSESHYSYSQLYIFRMRSAS